MDLKDWFKKQMTAIAIATANVEKDMLNQKSVETEGNIGKFQRIGQGTLMDSLINGEVTQEVEDLRWRMFRVLNESEGLTANIDDYVSGDTAMKASVIKKNSFKEKLKKVKVDDADDYPVEIVLNNTEIALGGLGSIEDVDMTVNEGQALRDTVIFNDEMSAHTATLGNVTNDNYGSSIKTKRPLLIYREFMAKFNIEDYTKKMNIRTINDEEKLLEFYVSKYPDAYNRKSNLFLAQVKKAMVNPRICDFLDFSEVGFVAHKTPGARDFHQYQYKIKNFDKIVEFDGHYVIKFKSEVTVNGEYLLEKYRSEGLDERYKNKEAKK